MRPLMSWMNALERKRKRLYASGWASFGKKPPSTTPRARPTKIQRVLDLYQRLGSATRGG